MNDSAPWKTEETIVGLPRLLVLSVFPDLILQIWWLSPFWCLKLGLTPMASDPNGF